MHPLPKIFEIEDEIDESNYAYYFQQAENGLYIRKALLILLLGFMMGGGLENDNG
jgi:aspartate carbamoyltransferase catalytic subunit